jgi:hypothetical protein
MLSDLHIQTAIIFIPMIVEFFLKLRGNFLAENYATRASNGHLEYHGRTESMTHILMKTWNLTERRLVMLVWGIEGAICTLVIVVDLLL